MMPRSPRLSSSLVVSLAAAFLAGTPAGAVGDPPNLVIQALGAAGSRGVLTFPLRKGVLQTKLAPVYLVVDGNKDGFSNRMRGYGNTVAATYGLTDHWGVSALMSYVNISGDSTLSFRTYGGQDLTPARLSAVASRNNGHLAAAGHSSGLFGAVSGVWDGFSGDDFRLPLYAGLGYMSVYEVADSPGYGAKRTGSIGSPGYLIGAAPSVGFWKFRGVAYLLIAGAFSTNDGEIVDYDAATGAVNSRRTFGLEGGLGAATPLAGLELTYKPWGLGFTYSPDVDGENATAYGLKWSREWGGPKKGS